LHWDCAMLSTINSSESPKPESRCSLGMISESQVIAKELLSRSAKMGLVRKRDQGRRLLHRQHLPAECDPILRTSRGQRLGMAGRTAFEAWPFSNVIDSRARDRDAEMLADFPCQICASTGGSL
jgi:hypothetical protein